MPFPRPLASLLSAALVAACVLDCRPTRPEIKDQPFDQKHMTSSVWLFGYDPVEARQLTDKVAGHQLIAVKYDVGADGSLRLDVMESCKVAGNYTYKQLSMAQQSLVITSRDELKAQLPISYAKFSGKFEQSSRLEIDYKSPGDYTANITELNFGPGCEGATHVVSRVAVGAFKTKSGANNAGGVGVGGLFGGAGGEGGSQGSNEMATSGGYLEKCDDGNAAANAPLDCSTPLQVTLLPVASSNETCSDSSIIGMTNGGFAFNGQVFTMEQPHLQAIDAQTPYNFPCDGNLSAAERGALTRINQFLGSHPGVKAHVSVVCTPQATFLGPGPMNSNLHEQQIRAVFASLGMRVTYSDCVGFPIPSGNGVYVELVSGCKEFGSPPVLKCQKAQ